jgi:hypothetical protein
MVNRHLRPYFLSVGLAMHFYQFGDVLRLGGKCMQVDWFPSPREARQEVNVFRRWSQ